MPVGEALKTFVYDDGEKLSAVTISKLAPDAKKMDICSIEADVDYNDDGEVTDVYGTSAIALGSSDRESPAFEGAQKLATIQCFEDVEKNINRENKKMGAENITFNDVVEAVKRMNIFPSQLYSFSDIRDDRKYQKEFADYDKKVSDVENERDAIKQKLSDMEKETGEVKLKALKADSYDRMKKSIPEGSTEKQIKYIENAWKSADLKDFTDDEIKSFIDKSVNGFAETAKIFGVSEDTKNSVPSSSTKAADDVSELDAVMEELNKLS